MGNHEGTVGSYRLRRCKGLRFWRPGPAASDFRHAEVLPTLTARAESTIAQMGATGRPFFLYFPLPAPHTPILPAPEFQGKSGTNPYGDFCLMVDDVVGRVMSAVERAGIGDNTILIFTADNGCSPTADFPGLAQLGHYPGEYRGTAILPFEGESFLPLLQGRDVPRERPIFWEHEGNSAVRDGDWKLVRQHGHDWELYNMLEDRTELRDLSRGNEAIRNRLLRQYKEWAQRCGVRDWPLHRI